MIKIPTKIEIKESPCKGLGVFAIEDIEEGEIIEESFGHRIWKLLQSFKSSKCLLERSSKFESIPIYFQ